LKKYIKEYDIVKEEQLLFTNSRQNHLTRVGVQYIIDKYVERGRKMNPDMLRKNITNHSFRHSKSMHLLEAGVNLLYIRDFLGHTSVTTTEIYAKTNAEIKRKVIEQHGVMLDIKDKYSASKKDELLDWLKSDFK
jgi:Site-specific recombinase XerD